MDFHRIRFDCYKALSRVKGIGEGSTLSKIKSVSLAWLLRQAKIRMEGALTDSQFKNRITSSVPGVGWELAGRMLPVLHAFLQDMELSLADLDQLQLDEDAHGRRVDKNAPVIGGQSSPAPIVNPPAQGKPMEKMSLSEIDKLADIAAQARIAPKYVPPPFLTQMSFFIQAGRVSYLTGAAGTGKNTAVAVIAKKLNRRVFRVNFFREMTEMHLVGAFAANSGSTRFVHGPVPNAMRWGLDENGNVVGPAAILVLDEVDRGNPDTNMVLQRLLEGAGSKGRSLMIAENGGEEVIAHPDLAIVLTGNTRGAGDDTGRYIAASQQDSALLNRVDFVFEFQYPDIRKVYEGAASKDFLNKLNVVFGDIQTSISKGDLVIDFGLRQINSLIFSLRAGIELKDALDGACFLRYNRAEAAALREIFVRQFGSSLSYNFSI